MSQEKDFEFFLSDPGYKKNEDGQEDSLKETADADDGSRKSEIPENLNNDEVPATKEELNIKIAAIHEKYKGHEDLKTKEQEEIDFWKKSFREKKASVENNQANTTSLFSVAREMQDKNIDKNKITLEKKKDDGPLKETMARTFLEYFDALSQNPIKGEEDMIQEAMNTVSEEFAADFKNKKQAKEILEQLIVGNEDILGGKIENICRKNFQGVIRSVVEAQEATGIKVSQSLDAAEGTLKIISEQSLEIGLPEKYVQRLTESLREEWLSDERLMGMLDYQLGEDASEEVEKTLNSIDFSELLRRAEELSNLVASQEIAQLVSDKGFDSKEVKKIWQELMSDKLQTRTRNLLKEWKSDLESLESEKITEKHGPGDVILDERKRYKGKSDREIKEILDYEDGIIDPAFWTRSLREVKKGIKESQAISNVVTKTWEEINVFKENTDKVFGKQKYLDNLITEIKTFKSEADEYSQQLKKYQR